MPHRHDLIHQEKACVCGLCPICLQGRKNVLKAALRTCIAVLLDDHASNGLRTSTANKAKSLLGENKDEMGGG